MAINKYALIVTPSALRFTLSRIFHAVIGRFLGDMDIVRVAFGHARGGYPAESRLAAKRFNIVRATIAHARTDTAHHLIYKIPQRPAIRHAAFDSFGNQLLGFR